MQKLSRELHPISSLNNCIIRTMKHYWHVTVYEDIVSFAPCTAEGSPKHKSYISKYRDIAVLTWLYSGEFAFHSKYSKENSVLNKIKYLDQRFLDRKKGNHDLSI